MRKFALLLLAGLALAACATSSGDPVTAIADARIAAAYIPLKGGFLGDANGAAVVVAPGVAVTNAHNRNLLSESAIIGQPKEGGYDLLYFRIDRQVAPPTAMLQPGQRVIAYGQGADHELRVAHGVVRQLPTLSADYFVFEGNAGPGFSGGPVIDEADGRLLGITFGYKPAQGAGQPLIYGYDIARVRALYGTLENRP
jgi:hypothetical protein